MYRGVFFALHDLGGEIGIIATGRHAAVVLAKPPGEAEIGKLGSEIDGAWIAAVQKDVSCR